MYRSDFARCPLDGGELAIAGSDPLIGSQVDRYEIEALIGEGAMGRVYRVHHARLVEKHYALKVLVGDLVASTSMRLRFANEAHAVAKLEHPNVVGIVDFGRTPEGLMYLVMELVEGVSLGAIARRGPMRTSRLLGLASQLCDGLAHAHTRGLIHRDFKPDNILVVGNEPNEVPRIVDFGLAISPDGTDARLTAEGVCCTPAYAAPEQVLGRELDHRVDLYGLGVTLYELASGALPFDGPPADVVTRKVSEKARSIGEVAPSLPAHLVHVIDRLLERNRDRRFSSAHEVQAALQAADGIERAPTLLESKVVPVAARPRRSSWRGPGALLAGMVVVAGAALALPRASALTGSPDVQLDPVPENVRIRVTSATQDDSPPPTIVADASPVTHRHRSIAAPTVVVAVTASPDEIAAVADETAAPAVSPTPAPAPSPPVSTEQASPQPAPPPRSSVVVSRRMPTTLQIAQLDVEGAMSSSVVRRAVERTLATTRCMSASSVRARFSISDERRASELTVSGAGADCVTLALTRLRTEIAPDVGDAHVTLTLSGSTP